MQVRVSNKEIIFLIPCVMLITKNALTLKWICGLKGTSKLEANQNGWLKLSYMMEIKELSVKWNLEKSVAWLSAFATSDDSSGGKGPKAFSAASWGKIGNIGGEQVAPMAIETVTVPAGTWETIQVGWKTGGASSKVWIVDGFPFPINAKTYTHVSEGIPPTEYEFMLLDYKENVQQTPFAGIVSTADDFAAAGCDTNIEKEVSIKKPTNNFDYQVHVFYGPEDPVQGCEMQWLIKFISKYDDTEFLNQVQFDFLTVDDNLTPHRSIAQDEGSNFLYSPS